MEEDRESQGCCIGYEGLGKIEDRREDRNIRVGIRGWRNGNEEKEGK